MNLLHTVKRTLISGAIAISTLTVFTNVAKADMKPVYDLSEYQRSFTASEVQQLKNETSFVILKAQNGSSRLDPVFNNNSKLLDQAAVPYGAYSYSCYTSVADAANEARTLYQRAPHAKFYVNDCEVNDLKSGNLNDAGVQWAKTMKSLTNKPVILYSGLDFMNRNLNVARTAYSALWVASYGAGEPNPSYSYDLWQYTDHQSSAALGQKVDASVIPTGGKPLSFWTQGANQSSSNSRASKKSNHAKHTVVINNNSESGYYTDFGTKHLRVIAKQGLKIYDQKGNYLATKPYGTVINIKGVFCRNGRYVALTPNGNICSTSKQLVSNK